MFDKEQFFKELTSLKATITSDLNADELCAIVESYNNGGIFSLISNAFLCGYLKGRNDPLII